MAIRWRIEPLPQVSAEHQHIAGGLSLNTTLPGSLQAALSAWSGKFPEVVVPVTYAAPVESTQFHMPGRHRPAM